MEMELCKEEKRKEQGVYVRDTERWEFRNTISGLCLSKDSIRNQCIHNFNAYLFYKTIHVACNQEMLNKTHIAKGLWVYVIKLFEYYILN